MNRGQKHFPLVMVIAVFALANFMFVSAQPTALPPARRAYNFNPGWKVFVGDPPGAAQPDFDDSSWKPVTLPYAWNEDFAFKVAINQLPTGIAWYRKRFRLPSNAAGAKVFLEFEGLRQGGEFYLNGHFLGRHENGVMAFGFDITEYVLPPPHDNVLAVRTDNAWDYREKATGTRFQWNDRNFNANYGGLVKNVRLHVTGKLYQTLPLYSFLKTTGPYVYATDFDLTNRAATITVQTEVRNEHNTEQTFTLEVVLCELNGRVRKRFKSTPCTIPAGATTNVTATARVQDLNFWSWGYGYLYDVFSILRVEGRPVDTVRIRTGFRQTEFARGMVALNGRVIHLKGYAQRTSNEWPALGCAVPPWLSDFSNGLIVQGNGALVRWMHVTPSKQDVESCDRVGLLQAMPAGDAESDARGRQWEQRLELMRDAIIYNRNNPSIIFYECGNKNISEQHMAEMKALRDLYDPHGGRAIGAREMLDSQVAEYGGEMLYINKSARIPLWAMEYSRDEGLRKYWDEFSPPFHRDGDGPPYRGAPAYQYNRNQDSHAIENVIRWYDYWAHRPGTGSRVNAGGVNIIFSDSNTHFRGAENYRRSGEVDPMRIPKDAFWAHWVMWDGWVDTEQHHAHIVGHWNYPPGTRKNVYVIATADTVELFLNGQSIGRQSPSYHFLFTFTNVLWQPGHLRAVGYDAAGRIVCTAEKFTTGPATAIRLTPFTAPGGLKADGADVALVEVEVIDAKGHRCPTNLNLIHFTLLGPAEWRGGIAQGPDNYILATNLPVECGVNRVLIRSKPQPGTITLIARADGLKPATVRLKSRPVHVLHGLATVFPDDGLRPRFTRGPTPAGPSFTTKRIAVSVASVNAGANVGRAPASYDDNERTSWSNDNRLDTAWIAYELERPARLTEVVMKLSGWRQRTYPIRITVDGQEVFRGSTPPSLGYVTLPLRPVLGRTVKLELADAASLREEFNITELGNPPATTADNQRLGTGTLGIVEIEFYEKARD